MAERNFPNDYFAWFNDDQRIAILSLDTTSTDSSERTTEKFDTSKEKFDTSKEVLVDGKSQDPKVYESFDPKQYESFDPKQYNDIANPDLLEDWPTKPS